MAKYRFELTDYRAVKEANIALDGLTVLSGLNGTGKSTVAKCLYDTVEILIDRYKSDDSDQGQYDSAALRKEQDKQGNIFAGLLSKVADSKENTPIRIQLWEDEVELLNPNEIRIPEMLNEVVYINNQELGNPFASSPELTTWKRLLKMLAGKSEIEVSETSQKLATLVETIIGGEVKVEKRHEDKVEKTEFYFEAKNGKSFSLKGAGSGIISFSYILQLLQNGWLTDKTMLIIDEPESHLHPQWIVDYARILVLINKMLGTKILLSSHNPDMIAVIQTISESKGLKDITRFYLAKPSPDSPDQNYFKDLGFNIEEIFDSFNIALERIDSYGTPS